MSTITLNGDQRKRANDILQRLSRGEIVEPMDIVEQWEIMPNYDDLDTDKPVLDMNLQRERKYISVSNIIGTGTGAEDRLEQSRLKNAVELLVEGKFKEESERPPKIEGISGDYYVAVDGVHRSLAFKAIGTDEMYAEVVEIPVN